ncbi:MAG: ankyrin repeat domain-containing protein [Desulfobacterales bacterium]|nr:ankyrin repeat domain-containing protein [Desulfobacterales bacterium]
MRIFNSIMIILLGCILCSCMGLFHSAKVGDIDGIQNALEKGASIEKRNQVGRTALMMATYHKNPKAMVYLLDAGADINAQDQNGATAFIHAVFYNQLEETKILLKYNPDQSIKDKYGYTGWQYADKYRYIDMLKLLDENY